MAPLIRLRTTDEAVALANDTPFGLVAYFYSGDLNRAWRVGERVEYGMVGVNEGLDQQGGGVVRRLQAAPLRALAGNAPLSAAALENADAAPRLFADHGWRGRVPRVVWRRI